ncbi:MAG: pyridoxamine 5'-phosphate oxidase family protein [Gemmatimonadota bacterium]|nr:pyridoxamine 5'-phosphate oxidase family protein [Gemmatimonadota bacterium]
MARVIVAEYPGAPTLGNRGEENLHIASERPGQTPDGKSTRFSKPAVHAGHAPTPSASIAMTLQPPKFRELDDRESRELLARNHVGRMAYALHDRVDILPIHYVCDDNWIYARTSPSHKLAVLQHNKWVAFEVDEVEGLFNWRSVVVRGGLYLLGDDTPVADPAARERALELLRSLLPETLEANDPVAFRTILFRVAVQELSGRAAEQPGATR